MFQGYYGRRRLKTYLIYLLGAAVFVMLLIRRSKNRNSEENGTFKLDFDHNEMRLTNREKFRFNGILSHFEFTNSPYLDFRTLSESKIVPIIVLSKAAHIEVRDAIRRTWGFNRAYQNDDLRIRLFFLVGTDDFMTHRTRTEQVVFDDVIQVNIPDMYSFIAYKELAAMLWMRSYLPEKKFFFKTEDHIILNMKLFVDKLLPIVENVAEERLIIGWFSPEHTIPRGKYQKFIDSLIPPATPDLHYAMSLLYATTSLAADQMLRALNNIELIEYPGDPFVTGILRDAANVKTTNVAKPMSDLSYEISNGRCGASFENKTDLLICTTSLYRGASNSMQEYFDAWNVLIGQK